MNDKHHAWGKLLAAKNYYGVPVTDPNSIVLINPLRYRGYVYDDETGLYYLQSRYYDPTTCRFINADSTKHLIIQNSLFYSNLYSYCDNNPLSYVDANGECLSTIFYTLIGYIGAMTPAIISGGIFTLSNSITAQMYLLSFYNLEPYRLYDLSDNQMYVQKIKSSHEYNESLLKNSLTNA